MGIEPTYSAWKAEVLPLNYTRAAKRRVAYQNRYNFNNKPGHNHPRRSLSKTTANQTGCFLPMLVEGGGFEPPKAEPSDLQSDPFDHSGTPPKTSPTL